MKLILALALVSSLSFAAQDKKPAEAPKKGAACKMACCQDKAAGAKDKACCEGKDMSQCQGKEGAKDCPGHPKAGAKKMPKQPQAPQG